MITKFKDGNNNKLWMVVSFLLAIFTIWIVIKKSGSISINILIDTIRSANKGWLFLGILASALYVGLEGSALRCLLKCAGYNRSRMKALIYSTSDIYFSAITPSASGGQPASAFFMIRDGAPGGVAVACLVINLIMYTLSIIVLGIIVLFTGSSMFRNFGSTSKIFICLGFVVLTLLAIFFVSIMLMGEKLFDFIEKIIIKFEKRGIAKEHNKKIERLEKAKNDYKVCTELISGNPKMMVLVFVCNLFQRASQIAVPMFIYLSLGGNFIKAPCLFSKQCLITVGYNFVPVPGAMGISDYLMIDGYLKLMSSDMAYKIEMISRGITFYICVLICGIITLLGFLAGKKNSDNVDGNYKLYGEMRKEN